MVKKGSLRYNVLKIHELISNYMDGSETAEIELSNLVIKGEELIGALNEIRTFYDERNNKATRIIKTSRKQTHDLREKYVPTKKYTKSELEKSLREYFINQKEMPFNYPIELNKYMNGRDLIETIVRAKNDAKIIRQTKSND